MKKLFALTLFLSLFAILTIVPALAQEAEVVADNLTGECVTEYDPEADYFPEKATVSHAEGFSIDYFNNYKVINVLTPWPGATAADAFQYVLIQCGTPPPANATFPDTTQFLEVPAGNIIAMSTTQLPQLSEMGLLDHLIGLDSFLYVNTPEVRDLIDAGALVEVGNGAGVNVEVVLDAEPDIVMTYGNGVPEFDAHPVLIDAGVFVALNSEYVEKTLLGRAEWIKFAATFYNQEALAETIFDSIVAEYEAVSDLANAIPDDERLTVLWNSYTSFSESWPIPGQDTWAGALLEDAGVNYVLMEEAPSTGVQFGFEAVYEAGLDAPIWVPGLFGVSSLDDLLAQDARYEDFTAVQTGMVYNNDAQVNENGGNNFWERGMTNPHLILQDLVAIFYPDLLPDHELVFYRKLESAE